MPLTRRALLAAAGAAGLPAEGAFRPARAQAERVIRYAISMADIPQTTGQPDRGAGAYQFTGHTLYDPLVAWEMDVADRPGKLVPGLATSWEADPADRRRWTFRLREGVRFHDGSLFDADAVVWNFDKVLNGQAPHFDNRQAAQVRPRLPSVASWRKLDPTTVEVTTKAVDSFFPYQMLWFLISSPAQYEKLGRSWDRFAQEPSGTGPFRLARLVPRERAELVRNAAHWSPALLAEGRPHRPGLRARGGDPHQRPPHRPGGRAIETPAPDLLPRLHAAGARLVQNVTPHVWNYHLSLLEGSPWRDIRLRRAANLAINRDEVVSLLNGLAKPAAGVVDPASPWFGRPDFAVRTDLDAARKLVAEAGYGPRNPLRTRFIIPTGGSGQMQSLPMNEYIQSAWREVGIAVEFQAVELEVLYTCWRQGAGGEIARAGGITANNVAYLTSDPLYAFIRFFHSNQIAPTSVNYAHYRDADMDRMLDAATSSFDAAEQDAIMRRVHEKVVNEALWVFVVHDTNPHALGRGARTYTQAQHWFQDLTTLG
jgi:peptide/nickel transport system substrate-binding protein